MRVAFLGLGVMGGPMAGHLAAAGHEVRVYNRTAERARAWCAQHGGQSAPDPCAVVADAEAVLCCLGDDPDVRGVLLDAGAIDAAAKGALVIDHTTGSAVLARELHERCSRRGLRFLDAPVSGGQAGAESGALTVMVGGAQAAFDTARPVIDAYARACLLMGPAGAGQLTKMVNQICIAGLVQGLSEGLNFAQRAGLDGEQVVDVLAAGAAQSWQMDNRAKTMLRGEFEFGFAVDWMRKDLAICLAEARANGARLPVRALVDELYAAVQARGGNRWDTSSLIEVLRDRD